MRLGLSPEELREACAARTRSSFARRPRSTPRPWRRPATSSSWDAPGSAWTTSTWPGPPSSGVMVVNAPQSNILSAAEQTMALLLAQARNVPQAHAALTAGKWERSKWEGVELHGKTLGVIGLGKIGALVAQRALAFGMHLVAYDPFISEERARHMGVDLMDLDVAAARERLHHGPPAQEQGDHQSPQRRDPASHQGRRAHHQRRARGHRQRGRPGRGDPLGSRPGRRARRLREGAHDRVAAVRPALGSRRAPPGRLHRRGPGQGRRDHRRAGRTRPRGRLRALRGQRRGRRGLQRRAALHGPRRAAGTLHRRTARRQAGRPRGHLPGRAGRRGHQDPHALRPQGVAGRDRARRRSPSSTPPRSRPTTTSPGARSPRSSRPSTST